MFPTQKSAHYRNKVKLQTKTRVELLEMLRQNTILRKKYFIDIYFFKQTIIIQLETNTQKRLRFHINTQCLFRRFANGLPDKGEKINKFGTRIEEELRKHHGYKTLNTNNKSVENNGNNRLDTLKSKDTGISCIPYYTAQNNNQSYVDDRNTQKTFVSQLRVNLDVTIKYTVALNTIPRCLLKGVLLSKYFLVRNQDRRSNHLISFKQSQLSQKNDNFTMPMIFQQIWNVTQRNYVEELTLFRSLKIVTFF